MSKFKITPSMLSSYQFTKRLAGWQFDAGKRDSPEPTYDELLELVTRTPTNEAMLIGSSVHEYLETGETSGFPIANTRKLNAMRATFITTEPVATEARMQRQIECSYGTCVMSGMADVLGFDFGIDWKVSTKKRNAESYFDSVQAFAYLWLFDVPRWYFITLKANWNAESQVIESVDYGNMIRVPRTNQTTDQLLHWIELLIEDLNYHNLLDKITLT